MTYNKENINTHFLEQSSHINHTFAANRQFQLGACGNSGFEDPKPQAPYPSHNERTYSRLHAVFNFIKIIEEKCLHKREFKK